MLLWKKECVLLEQAEHLTFTKFLLILPDQINRYSV